MCALESLDEGTGSRFFANGVERACLGTCARVRHKADRNLYWPASQKDRWRFNRPVDQDGASSGLCGARRPFSMKHYSLRWKLVTWAALFAFSASVICLWTTWILVRAQEIQALDRRLVTDARELFRDIENFQGTNKRRDVTERFVVLALRDRLVEVGGPDGEILYMSPNLSEPILKDGIETFHTRQIGGRAVWIGVFRDQELTLHVGADLKDIEQLGWE